jgi:hypothetical protein
MTADGNREAKSNMKSVSPRAIRPSISSSMVRRVCGSIRWTTSLL